jgi:hypothetical protein
MKDPVLIGRHSREKIHGLAAVRAQTDIKARIDPLRGEPYEEGMIRVVLYDQDAASRMGQSRFPWLEDRSVSFCLGGQTNMETND